MRFRGARVVAPAPRVQTRWRVEAPARSAPRAAATRDAGPARVAVFVSGGGSNMRALHAAMLDGRVDAEVAVVVSNAPDCGA